MQMVCIYFHIFTEQIVYYKLINNLKRKKTTILNASLY